LTNFESLGVSKPIVATLFQLGIETPTPIQEKAIPLLLEGRDLIGLAQTGTGKTAAFGLPLIEKLIPEERRPDNRTTRTLILAPTRELVNQIAQNLKNFLRKSHLRINVVVGGVSINKQQLQLEKGTDILVATPGRLLDLVNRRAIGLTAVRYLVLDEADQMLDLGFVHDLRKISKMVPKKRQTMLFSATMPKAIADLAADFLTDPVKVEVTPPGKAADKVEQYVHFVNGKNDKTDLLKKSLSENPDGRAIVFLRTKHGAEKLMKHLETCRLLGCLDPRQQEPGPARARPEGLQGRRHQDADRHRRCRPRHRHPGRQPRLQLRPAGSCRSLRPPHRPYGPCRSRRHRDRLLRA
jgi:ATP-dependent RNA helicase RhlE